MNFPYPVRDNDNGNNNSGLDITHSGCQTLNGNMALGLARSRFYEYEVRPGVWEYDGSGDLGRIQRQNAIIEAVIDKAKSSSYNPLKVNSFLGSIVHDITKDDAMSTSMLLSLAQRYHAFSGSSLQTLTLPTTGASSYVGRVGRGRAGARRQPDDQPVPGYVAGPDRDATPRRLRVPGHRAGVDDHRSSESGTDGEPSGTDHDRAGHGSVQSHPLLRAGVAGHRLSGGALLVVVETLGQGVPRQGGALDADRELDHSLQGGELAQGLGIQSAGAVVTGSVAGPGAVGPSPRRASWTDIIALKVRIRSADLGHRLALHRRRHERRRGLADRTALAGEPDVAHGAVLRPPRRRPPRRRTAG